MKAAFFTAAALAPLALAGPVIKRQDIDTVVLQFALTLEHLENVFYKQALQNFTAEDFAAAGYGANYYNTLKYISSDEESHTKFLTAALTGAGVMPNKACTYKFPYTDVKSFITLSTVLEGVGTSAYLGGAPLITNKDYLTAAGAILVSEALHTSLQRNAIKALPNANPYWTPLNPTPVFTLAAAFIVACPPENMALPFTPFPSLTVNNQGGFCEQPDCTPPMLQKRDAEAHWKDWEPATTTSVYYPPATTTAPPAHETTTTSVYYPPATTTSAPPAATYIPSAPVVGDVISFTAASAIDSASFVTFVSGLMVVSVVGTINGASVSAPIPAGISGQSYVFITKSNVTTTLADDQISFGPAILEVKPAPPSIDFSYYKQ